MRSLGAASWLLLGTVACSAPVAGPDGEDDEPARSWVGLYRGVIPCADCEGIDTVLELRADGTWERFVRYLGENAEPFRSSGELETATPAGADATPGEDLLFLDAGSSDQVAYRVEEDALLQLDRELLEIEGDLADRYRLRRIGTASRDPRRLDGEWWVTELDGSAVEPDRTRRRRPHVRIDFLHSRLSFTGGCNQFAGTVDFEGAGRITMGGPFAGTRMRCPGRADLDQELTDALQSVGAWRIRDQGSGAERGEDGAVLELLATSQDTTIIRLVRPTGRVDAEPAEEGAESP